MKRSEFLKIIAGLGLMLPAITSAAFPETIVLGEDVYDVDAEHLIKRLEECREVSNDEKTAIRHWFKYCKEIGVWDKLECFYPLAGPKETARINWINPDPRYDLK